MKKLLLLGMALIFVVGVCGCGDMGKPAVSKDEQKNFEHPVKEPPPEAGFGGPPGGGGAPAGSGPPNGGGAPPGSGPPTGATTSGN